jgi:CHASE2 domain-containing sensor protein
LCLAALFALFWIHFLNHVGVDDWIERHFLRYASHSTSSMRGDDVVIIALDPAKSESLAKFGNDVAPNQAWREHHARLLDRLAAVPARLVAFDFVFPAPVEQFKEANGHLATAIRSAKASGKTHVIVGALRDMDRNAELEAELPRDQMGLVNVREISNDVNNEAYLARVLLAESAITLRGELGTEETVLLPLPMPLAMYLAYRRPELGDATLSIDPSRGALVVRPAGGEPIYITAEIQSCEIGTALCSRPPDAPRDATILRRAVLPLWMGRSLGFSERDYVSVVGQEKLDARSYGDRAILVGALTPDELQKVGPGGPDGAVYGVHVHARVFTDLMSGTYLRHASAPLQFLSFVLVLLTGLLARLYMPIKVVKIPIGWLKDFPLPVGFFLVTAFYLLAALLIFRSSFVFFDLGYQLLALAAGYYAVPALAGLVQPDAKEAK